MGALESAAAIAGRQVDLSEQQGLCCSGAGTCNGGWWLFDWAVKQGVGLDKDLPYTARYGRCPTIPTALKALTWGYVAGSAKVPTNEQLRKFLCDKGPLAVCLRADGRLSNYVAGTVWQGPAGSINHAVLLIGWKKLADGTTVWIIKNSWGSNWGDKAYRNRR